MSHQVLPAAAGERLTILVGQMLGELRGTPAPPVRLDDRLEQDLGIDSLARVELVLRIERAFEVRLPESLAADAHTLRELLRAVAAASPRIAAEIAPAAERPVAEVSEPREAATLIDALTWQAERHPGRSHITLLEGDDVAGMLTYGELAAEARAVARGLASRGLEPGAAVAIMLPTGRDFFRAFFGVLLAGGVPVPMYPPFRWSLIEEHLRRQAGILSNCVAPVLIAPVQARPVARLLQAQVPSLRDVLTVAELILEEGENPAADPGAGDLALIQYTSGSTGQPKGVALSHSHLLANIRAMARAAAASSRDVFVSWLPLYHDMGLIGAWLSTLYYGIPLILMPPQSFLGRPARWLWTMHRYRGTLSAGPNFAYEILGKLPEDELKGLDLSSWRLAFNGAEPVHAATLEKFTERYASHGFDPRAFAPVYGLAECALGLTFPPLGRPPLVDHIDARLLALEGRAQPMRAGEGATAVVSCGRALSGHQVRVVDTLGRELPDRTEGRIEFSGPSATSGYFSNPEASTKLIRDGWLDTGDVGYMAGGELYLTSRVKDIIIRGGQHIHPYDLEEAIGALSGVRKGCVAVFGAADRASGTERVVVAAETRAASAKEREALRARIAELAGTQLGAPADDIVLVGKRTVLKTSSGKIRRAACRELYEHGRLGERHAVAFQLARLALSAAPALASRLLRGLGTWLFAAYLWALFAVLSGAGLALVPFLSQASRRRVARALARAFVASCGVPVQVKGAEHFEGALPAVIVANHTSYCDFLLLAAIQPADATFTAKREFLRHLLLGALLRGLGARFVERFDTQRAVEDARRISRALGAGETQVFFPEGTFSRAPGLRVFHMGAFVAAAEMGRPVIPVALRGTRSVLRDGSWLPRRRAIEVSVHEPLTPRGHDWAEAVRLRNAARDAILKDCGEPDAAVG